MSDRPLPSCIALHGFLGCAEDWTDALVALARPALPVTLPGHRETASSVLTTAMRAALMAPPSIDTWADALADALRRSGAEANPVDVMGYSLGGRVGIALADRHPALVRRLVLVSTSLGIERLAEREARSRVDQERALQLANCDAAHLREWVLRWYQAPLFTTLAATPITFADTVDARCRNSATAMAEVVAALSPGVAPYRGEWSERTTIPTLWIAGSRDEGYAQRASAAAGRMLRGRVVIVKGGGHALLATHPVEVGQAAASWLSRESSA
ncbi:MAG: 2-succinyl-6-hydroxy-2,4-cyclohexadiene-1-carboxylate synthase [Flavobacteriales bacterium]|jgi:2-succinyl-6-hydroxy-2,4-cyclohexadiene-1-carboxylate synthase